MTTRVFTPTPISSLTEVYEAAPAVAGPGTDEGAVRFLSLAARAYAAVDELPARIEEGLVELAQRLGFVANCNATATAIFITITKGERNWTEVIRIKVGGPDYTRAVALHRILARVMRREITPEDAIDRLTTLLRWRHPTRPLALMIASALISASAALLLRAQLPELLLVMAMGAAVGGLLVLTAPREALEPLVPVVLAAFASAVAFSATRLGVTGARPVPILIASLVILLPGWRLTVAMTELAQGHWTSGAGRFLAAITTLLLLIVGVVVGQQATQPSDHARLVLPAVTSVPTWVRVLSPLAAGAAMTVLFSARRKDGVLITLVCIVTSLVAYAGGRWLGFTAGAFVGAFTATAAGTLLARHYRLPYSILQQPATVLLVPGSIGFLSFGSLVDRDVNAAIQTGFQMLFVALTLALGAMAAQVALRPLTVRSLDHA